MRTKQIYEVADGAGRKIGVVGLVDNTFNVIKSAMPGTYKAVNDLNTISQIRGSAAAMAEMSKPNASGPGWTFKADRPVVVGDKPDAVSKESIAEFAITKSDDDRHNVYGWAYVTNDRDGNMIIDKSGEFTEIEELEKAAYDFVLKSRASDHDHRNEQTGTMIESVVFTPEKIEKMGLPEGSVPYGWWVGFHVPSDDVWSSVKSGERSAFSIHGSGVRKAV